MTFAQAENKTVEEINLLPQKGNLGVSLLVDGLIDNLTLQSNENELGENILFAKYYLENDLVLRMGFGLNIISANRTTSDSVSVTLVERDSSASRYLINISGGAEKHLKSSKRLDPFIFSQVDLTFIGKTNVEINATTTSSAGVAKDERTIKQDGGFGIGLQLGGGFNYFLAKRFSLGAELSMRLQYVTEGGTITDNQIITPVNGSSTSNFISREDQQNQTTVNVEPNALINISYFF